MGLPQVPLGSRIRPNWQTDSSMQTHMHTVHPLFFEQRSLLLRRNSSHSPKAQHTLHKPVTLLYINFFLFFPDRKIIFQPSSLFVQRGNFEMNNGNNRAENSWDPFKDVERRCSQGLGCTNITLQVNESTFILHFIELLVWTIREELIVPRMMFYCTFSSE